MLENVGSLLMHVLKETKERIYWLKIIRNLTGHSLVAKHMKHLRIMNINSVRTFVAERTLYISYGDVRLSV